MADGFDGFSGRTLSFYRDLTENNDKTWFEAHKTEFQNHVQAPAQAFVAALGPRLQKLAPDIAFDPRLNGSGSIIRIYRDVRFSKDKSPYKNWLGIIFWATPGKRMRTPAFYFGLDQEGARFHIGWHGLEKPALDGYREAVAGRSGAALEKTLTDIKNQKGFTTEEPHYKRVPRGYPADHPRADLLRYNSMGASSPPIKATLLKKADLVDLCLDYAKTMKPLYQWLSKLNKTVLGV